ncbi:hypothetical protein [Methylotuvimicrobium buryatense]|uniref:hypothetical protein n=1 Tax=Methylotuvimicrobium buryatense TaxID=95641 RepID=UPI00058E82DF|nr:hypothetical protein [Methylotuvimicrobium buryatense]
MPVEERRKPIHGGLAAAKRQGWRECRFCRSKNLSRCRHPRQAHPTPFLIPKLGVAENMANADKTAFTPIVLDFMFISSVFIHKRLDIKLTVRDTLRYSNNKPMER